MTTSSSMGTPHASKTTTRSPPPTPLTSGCATEANGPPDEGIHLSTPAPLPHFFYFCLTLLRFVTPRLSASSPLHLCPSDWMQGSVQKASRQSRRRAAARLWLWSEEGSKRCAACFLDFNTLGPSNWSRNCQSWFLFGFHDHKFVLRYLNNKPCVNKNHMSSRKRCIVIVAVLKAQN